MVTTHLIALFFKMGAGPVALPLPPFPSVAAPGTTTASTRNRRQLTLPDIGTLKLRTDRLTGSSEAKLRAPTGLTESYELVMPSSLPTTGQSLHVNSSGEMSFQGYRQTFDEFLKEDLGVDYDALMHRVTDDSGLTTIVAPRAGFVSLIAIRGSTASTGGSAQIELVIYRVGTVDSTGVVAVLESGDTHTTTITETAFAAGDRLSLKLTSDSSWSPADADIRGILEIET